MRRVWVLLMLAQLHDGKQHWHAAACAAVLGGDHFDRVLGSLHCLPDHGERSGRFAEPPGHYRHRAAADVVRQYLAEVARLVTGSDLFSVLAHIDYPVRSWPEREAGPFDPSAFEDEFRYALRTTAESGRALEISTRIPSLHSTLVRWWHEEGGQAVTFGSDAHQPLAVAVGFQEAAAMAQAHGFRPGRNPYDFWARAGWTQRRRVIGNSGQTGSSR